MKTFLSFIALALYFSVSAYGQSIKMSTDYPEDKSLSQLLQFQNIEMYNVKFEGEALKGKNYYIVAKEIWNGKIKSIDTLINSAKVSHVGAIQGNSLALSVISGKSSEKKLKLDIRFERIGLTREFKSTKSTDYSLRPFGEQLQIEAGKPFYALASILPYEKDGYKYWCAVESSGKDIEKWGSEFGIEHYILFEMKFF